MSASKKKELKLTLNNCEVDVIAFFETKKKFIFVDYLKKGKVIYTSEILIQSCKHGYSFIKQFDCCIALEIIKFNYEII